MHFYHKEECIRVLMQRRSAAATASESDDDIASMHAGEFGVLTLDELNVLIATILDLAPMRTRLVGVNGRFTVWETVRRLCALAQTCRLWYAVIYRRELLWLAEARARMAAAGTPSSETLTLSHHPFLQQLCVEELTYRQLDLFKEAGTSMVLHCAARHCQTGRRSINDRWGELEDPHSFRALMGTSRTRRSKPPRISVLWNTVVSCICTSVGKMCALVYKYADDTEHCSIVDVCVDDDAAPPWHPCTDFRVVQTVGTRVDDPGNKWTTMGVTMSSCSTFVVVVQDYELVTAEEGTYKYTRLLLWDTSVADGGFRLIEHDATSTTPAPVDVQFCGMIGRGDDARFVAYMDSNVGEGLWVRIDLPLGKRNYRIGAENTSDVADILNFTVGFSLAVDRLHSVIVYMRGPLYRIAILDMDSGEAHTLQFEGSDSFRAGPWPPSIESEGHPTIELSPNADVVLVEYRMVVTILRRECASGYDYSRVRRIDLMSLLRSQSIRPRHSVGSAPMWVMSPCGSTALCTFTVPAGLRYLRCNVDIDLHGVMSESDDAAPVTMTTFHIDSSSGSFFMMLEWHELGLFMKTVSGCLVVQ